MVIRKSGNQTVTRSTHSLPLPTVATDTSLLVEFGCHPIQVKTKAIGAVRMDLTQGSKRGSFCQLPFGSVVTVIGSGFNDQTVLVREQDTVYVVFRQDLGLPTKETIPPSVIS